MIYITVHEDRVMVISPDYMGKVLIMDRRTGANAIPPSSPHDGVADLVHVKSSMGVERVAVVTPWCYGGSGGWDYGNSFVECTTLATPRDVDEHTAEQMAAHILGEPNAKD